jgi:beta-aspartyl-peptidase (threonine type)
LTRHDFEQALARSLAAGYSKLGQKNCTSVDAVEAAVRVMEDCDLFNAGLGAAFNSDGRVELDAAIMEGTMIGRGEGKQDPRKRAGAVAAVTHVKNPISAARAVMEMEGSRHVLLVGDGAERFALGDANRAKYHIEAVSNLYFWTDRRLRQIRGEFQRNAGDASRNKVSALPGAATKAAVKPDYRLGTVGAVACDRRRLLAAGTSTGGLTNKLPGRLGDSPLLGCGTYADDRACGVSCTGTGEVFIRHAVAHDVVARMLYGGKSVADAVHATIAGLPDEDGGVGGLIALNREGRHAFGMSRRSVGMYRGYATEDGQFYVGVYANEPEKRIELTAAKDGKEIGGHGTGY